MGFVKIEMGGTVSFTQGKILWGRPTLTNLGNDSEFISKEYRSEALSRESLCSKSTISYHCEEL